MQDMGPLAAGPFWIPWAPAIAGAALLAVLFALAAAPRDALSQQAKPGAPTLQTVTSGDGALRVAWTAPSDAGDTAITAYDLRHLRTDAPDKADGNWAVREDVWAGAGDLTHTEIGVDNGVAYDVQVRAVNSNGDGTWSATLTGTPTDHGGAIATATVLEPGEPVVGYIADGNDDDYFSLTLSGATDIFIFTTSNLTGFLATTGELQDSAGTVIKTDDGDPAFRRHGNQLFLWASLDAGTYYVKVEAPSAGAYTLHTQPAPESTGTGNAAGMDLPGTATGILEPAEGDEDYFRLEAAEETEVMFREARTIPGMDLEAFLLDSEGKTVAGNDDSYLDGSDDRQFLLRWKLTPGVYYLKVRGAPAREVLRCNAGQPASLRSPLGTCETAANKPANAVAGPYTVSATTHPAAGDSFTTATPLSIGGNALVSGSIGAAGDAAYFSLTVTEATHVRVRVLSGDLRTTGTYHDSAQTEVDSYVDETDLVPGGQGFALHATLPAGTSYVKVAASDGTSAGGFVISAAVDTGYRDLIDTCTGLTTTITDPLYGCQWNLNNTGQNSGPAAGTSGEDINVEEVWTGGNLGADINVAIVDDGLYAAHPDLTDNVDTAKNHVYRRPGELFHRALGHGTEMAGIIAARDNAIGTRGVSPRAKIYAFNLLRRPTILNQADAATRQMTATSVSFNGWGFPDGPGVSRASDFWELAIDKGLGEGPSKKGIFYVFPGGNGAADGDYSNLSELVNYYGVTTACAVNDRGRRSAYSERGPNLWVCAPSSDSPAENRQSVLTTGNYGRYVGNSGGTAAAAATVSGVAALVRKANSNLTWRDVKLILAASARKNHTGDSGWQSGALKYGSTTERYNYNHSYGFGVVDAKAAVDLAASWTLLPRMRRVSAASAGNLALSIPDSGMVESTIRVPPVLDFIEFVQVDVNLRHGSFRDLDLELVSPSGAVSVLSEDYSSQDKIQLEGYFRFGSARHLGESAGGTWKLRLHDRVAGNTGTLLSWGLTLFGHGSGQDVPAISTLTPGSASLAVGWSIGDDTGVTAYDVRHIRSDATDKADANWTVKDNAWTSGGGAPAYSVTGLTNGVSYDIQVRAVRGSTDGNWSDTFLATPAAAAAAVPGISGVRAEEATLVVSWAAPATPPATVTAYDLRHIRGDATDKADANWTVIDNAWTTGTLVYAITGLLNGVGYDVQVRAVSSMGDGAWSATATGLPADFPGGRAAAPLVPLDTPVRGAVDHLADVDVVQFKLTATTEVVMYTTGRVDTRAVLWNSSGTELAKNDDSQLDDSSLGFHLARQLNAGTYYLSIHGEGRPMGAYTLRLDTRADTSGRTNAATLSPGIPLQSVLGSSSDGDYYAVTVSAGTTLILRSSGPTDTEGELQTGDGTELADNDNGNLHRGPFYIRSDRNFLIRHSLTTAGTYYLKVTAASGSGGPYAVQWDTVTAPGSTRATAAGISMGAAGAGSISAEGDTDYFSFAVSTAGAVGVIAAGTPADSTGNLLISGELQDSSGNALETYGRRDAPKEVGFRGVRYLEPGTYYVKVTGSTTASRETYAILVYPFGAQAREGEKCSGGNSPFRDPLSNCQWHLYNQGNWRVPAVLNDDIEAFYSQGNSQGPFWPHINIADVWQSHKGEGVNVAIVDEVVESTHPELAPNMDLSLHHSYTANPMDRSTGDSHGTAVAGIIAARDDG